MEQKKTLIAAEVQTVLSILQYYEQQTKSGEFSLKTAQDLAIKQIRGLRFGLEGKDYFWINDMQPRMVMHPYLSNLDGQDLSNYSDPEGKLLFKEFVDVVRKDGAGYVQYYWQWKDDQKRIVPKISYVKLFKPWGWIIGTGVYIEDIRGEIAKLTKELIFISVGIFMIILLLSVYIIRNSLKEMIKRLVAEKDLYNYKDGLEELVEKRTGELQEAMSKIKILSGFLPICASCKKIRDDNGCWNQIESYVRDHSEAEFSHGICPDCAENLYPELYGKKEK
jgi:signal transduction histidine kinase